MSAMAVLNMPRTIGRTEDDMKLHLKRTVFAWLVILTMMTAYPFAAALADDQSGLAQLLTAPYRTQANVVARWASPSGGVADFLWRQGQQQSGGDSAGQPGLFSGNSRALSESARRLYRGQSRRKRGAAISCGSSEVPGAAQRRRSGLRQGAGHQIQRRSP